MNERLKLAPVHDDAIAASLAAGLQDAEMDRADAAMAEKLAQTLSSEFPTTTTLITGKRQALERIIAKERAEKAEQLEIIRIATAKARQLTVSIHSSEAALDSLIASEA